MELFFAHEGHSEATGNAIEHGVSHWLILLPVIVGAALLMAAVLWLLSKPKLRLQEKEAKGTEKE